MSRKFKTDDIIMVVWVDQSSYGEPTKAKGSICKCLGFTLGFYLEEDDEWMSMSCEKMHGLDEQYRHTVTVPKVCIKKIILLKKGPFPCSLNTP